MADRPKKRPRVKRACDRCFASKDKCNGDSPCGMCQKNNSECTYERPQQRRGPQAGMRGKLEAKIETLESMLGFMLDQLGNQIYQQLLPSLDLTGQIKMNQIKASTEEEDHDSPDQDENENSNDIYPASKSKSQLASLWRGSDFAKSIAPGLNLDLGEDESKEEGGDSKKKATKPIKSSKAGLESDAGSSKGKGKARVESNSSNSSSFRHQRQESEVEMHFTSIGGMAPPSFNMATGFQQTSIQSPRPNGTNSIRSPAFPESDARLPPNPSSPHRIWERSPHAPHQVPFSTGGPPSSSYRQYLPPSRARANATNQLLEQMVNLPRELEEQLDHLLSSFFQHYHIVIPFVDKASLLRWSSENGARRFSQAVSGGETGTLALVLAICSLSAARSADAAKLGEAEMTERLRLISLSEDCHARARALFFCSDSGSVLNSGPSHTSPGGRADGTGDFEAVQCMLILAIVDIIQNRGTRAWIGLGMAIRLAQDMELQLEGRDIKTPASSRAATPRPASVSVGINSGSPKLPPPPSPLSNQASTTPNQNQSQNPKQSQNQSQSQNAAAQNRYKAHADQIRRLTWWALFNYDSFLSIALGRSTILRRQEFTTLLPDPAESAEEWELCTAHSPSAVSPDNRELEVGPKGIGKTVKARMISTFVAQTGLSEILSDLATIGQTKVKPKGGESVLAQHHAVLARLHEWRNNLPSHLSDCIVGNETPTSLAGPNLPSTPAPPNVWSLALHYHFAFIIANRSLVGAQARERADALAPQTNDPLVDDHSISSLWDTRAVTSVPVRGAEDATSARNSLVGKSDFFKVTMSSPTSEHALPRLLARYVSAFGAHSLPPTAAFYALAAAHALISPTTESVEGSAETQAAWENLTWAVSASVSWHPALRQVAKTLPIFSKAAAANSKLFLSFNPDPRSSPILNPNSPIFNFNPHFSHHSNSNGFNGFSPFDILPYSMDSTADELGSDAHALAYALGLPGDSGNTPSSSSNLKTASPLHHLNYSNGSGMSSFGTPLRSEDGDPLARFFDMGMSDQNSVLYQLGLQPDGTTGSRRNSLGLLNTSYAFSHPIQGVQGWGDPSGWSPHQPQLHKQHFSPQVSDSRPEEYSAPREGTHRRFGMSDASTNSGSPQSNRPASGSGAVPSRPGPSHHHISPHHQHPMQVSASPQTHPPVLPAQPQPQHHHQPHSHSHPHHQSVAESPAPRSLVPNNMDPNSALGAYDMDMNDMSDFGEVGDLLEKWAHRGSRMDAFQQNL